LSGRPSSPLHHGFPFIKLLARDQQTLYGPGMGKKLHRPPLAVVLLAIVLTSLISACGSSSSDPTTGSTAGNTAPVGGNGNPLSLGEQGAEEEQGEKGASSFIKPNSPNNKYAKFGQEASSAELTAASEVLAENLEARESADFATQCATLSVQANEEIAEVTNPSEARSLCGGALKKLASPLKSTEEFRANTFGGQLAAFRVKGKTGYALYHGTDGKDWMMPMSKEGSIWKANSIITTEV
jgi:hypothetical protein